MEAGSANSASSGAFGKLQQNLKVLRGLAESGRIQNRDSANEAMKLNPQELSLYDRHLKNLYGPGGVTNPDGSRSTLFQITAEIEGKSYVIPTVWEGKILTPDEAIERAKAEGLDSFPSYKTEDEAEKRYQQMHGFMDKDVQRYFSFIGGTAR